MADYSQEQLQEAFDKVADPDDWKLPIVAEVALEDLNITVEAIYNFTATTPHIDTDRRGNWFVLSIGYRKGPAGSP